MIETQILGSAVGIQRGNVIDNTEGTILPSLANGVLTGRFKRGRMDKPFKVNNSNYKALLGHDPSNPSYLAVEDAFKRGISELSIVRVGGTGIACIASYAIASDSLDSEFEWITVSRNGGEFKSFDLNGDDYESFDRMVYLGQDGKSLAFLDYEYQIDPEVLGGGRMIDGNYVREILYYYTFCGIASNGMLNTPAGNYDLKTTGIKYPPIGEQRLNSNNNITRAEHNWLVFKPTPDTDPDFDLFYKMGASGDTIEVHSCAVVEPYIDTNVCTPTYNDASVYSYNDNSEIVGTVHAKYRVNGGAWQNYTDDQDNGYNPVSEFLTSIVYNGRRMVNVAGGGGDSAFSTGYHADDIYGASATSQYMQDQTGIVEVISHTIDFEVTQNNVNDLVYAIFGKDTTIKSCAIGTWAGY